MYDNIKLILVGAGQMSVEYSKVLKALGINFTVVGRSEEKAKLFEEKTGMLPFVGGLEKYLDENKDGGFTHAIIAVSVEALRANCLALIDTGIKNILLEKPGGVNEAEIAELAAVATEKDVKINLAYNRRFYASVKKAKEIIAEDGGVQSFHFEFTEWGHQIGPKPKAPGVKEAWFLVNSTHVADTAFYLAGKPDKMSSFTAGEGSWHPSALIFSGAGITKNSALFSYQANWGAPGRWTIDILTPKHRLIFKPMEQLQIQQIGSVKVDPVEIDDKLDTEFKPGIYQQVTAWLNNGDSDFCSIHDHLAMMPWYNQIANY